MQKLLNRLRGLLTSDTNECSSYWFKDNWHSYPAISNIMCYLGRHDYEAVEVTYGRVVLLQCFYCLHQKSSHISDSSPIKI